MKTVSESESWDDAEAYLFWNHKMQLPSEILINQLLDQPFDVWHAGLSLGMKGLPNAINYVQPMWMLNCDADSASVSTSWRISPQACLVRADVVKKMGWITPGFETIEAAFLEMGHRWITNGVLMRHVPDLLGDRSKVEGRRSKLPFEDELRFIYCRFGKKWAMWALGRLVMTGAVSIIDGMETFDRMTKDPRPEEPKPYRNKVQGADCRAQSKSVSVLIPTLNRYSYLEKVLEGLRMQTIKPLEIVIVDQSRSEIRNPKNYEQFSDMPLQIIYQDEPGQCSSRNAGIQTCKGEYALFLDDDDEVEPDLIERHLRSLNQFKCEVSSGVADEVGAGCLPNNFTFLRQSDVFPTNNTMIIKELLNRSGLFDLAYNRKQRADADLGMRIYLSGAQMILNPDITVLHHHAPDGGLRQHKARKVTYAASRQNLWVRHLPSDSEIYLGLRYFSREMTSEFIWHKTLGTFSVQGDFFKRAAKVLIGLFCLPHTLFEIKKRYQSAEEMLKQYPEIPTIE